MSLQPSLFLTDGELLGSAMRGRCPLSYPLGSSRTKLGFICSPARSSSLQGSQARGELAGAGIVSVPFANPRALLMWVKLLIFLSLALFGKELKVLG